MKVKSVLLVLLISVFTCISISSEEKKEELSLEEAINIAIKNNPEIVVARKNIKIAKARVVQAKAFPNPDFEVGAKSALLNDKDSNLGIEIAVNQELDVFRKRHLNTKIAENEIRVIENELELIRINITRQVKETYFQILLTQKSNILAEDTLNLTRKFLDKVQDKYNTGKALKNELISAKIEVFEAQNELLVNEKESSINKMKLNILLGRSASHMFSCNDDLPHREYKLILNDVLKKAFANRQDLNSMQLMKHSEDMKLDLIKKDIFDNPSVGVSGEKEDGEQKIGVSLGISLPLWYRNQGEIAEGINESQKLEYQISSLKRQIELEVNETFQEFLLADKQVRLWKKAVENASGLIKLINLQYEEGKINFLTYLENMRKFKETKLNYFKVLIDYETKLAILEESMGGKL